MKTNTPPSKNNSKRLRTIAVVFFPEFAPLDCYGPIQAFNLSFQSEEGRPPNPSSAPPLYKVIAVGLEKTTYACGPSGTGPATTTTHTFESLPDVDILLIPGGAGAHKGINDAELINGIRKVALRTPIVATVCTGAALLAKTGFLDGRKATSNKFAWKFVISTGPKVDWVCGPRWVDCIDDTSQCGWITSGGVSAGIDMALAIINKLNGRQVVNNTQVLMEYSWADNPEQDAFAYLCLNEKR